MHAAMPPLRIFVLCAFLAILVGAMGFSLYDMLPTRRARLAVFAIGVAGVAAGAVLFLSS